MRTTNPFISAMYKLIKKRFSMFTTTVSHNVVVITTPRPRKSYPASTKWLFTLRENEITYYYRNGEDAIIWKFDIANPSFDPEDIIRFMKRPGRSNKIYKKHSISEQ